MKALLIAYWAPPLLSPESMLMRRMLYATGVHDVLWNLLTVCPRFSYGPKDYGKTLALETLPHPPQVEYALSGEYGLIPLYALFPRLRLMPDPRLGWVPFGISRGAKLMQREKFEVFVTWGQPHSSHLIGCALKRRYSRIPWVAYFGDPWVANPYVDHMPQKCTIWEQEVVHTVDRMIVNTKSVKNDFLQRYGSAVQGKIHVIPHSYDHTWLEGEAHQTARAPDSPLTLTYGGNFYGKRTPQPILRALNALSPQVRAALCVQFIGKFPAQWRAEAESLDSSVAVLGQKSYAETQALLRQSDMLLLIDAPLAESMFLPSKLVDYLALGKPILALTPRGGASWDALEGLDHVCLIDTDDDGQIQNVLKKIARGEFSFSGRTTPPEVFSPETVGAQWKCVLDEALKTS